MTNQEIIRKMFEKFRQGVHECGNRALCDQMKRTLEMSLNLHAQLEGGYHQHHLTESDSHGWAVADKNEVIGSGASALLMPNEYGSAEAEAKKEAILNNPEQKGVFTAVMVYPFEGGTGRSAQDEPAGGEPHDSMRFESKLQDLLKYSALQTVPVYFRKNIKSIAKK